MRYSRLAFVSIVVIGSVWLFAQTLFAQARSAPAANSLHPGRLAASNVARVRTLAGVPPFGQERLLRSSGKAMGKQSGTIASARISRERSVPGINFAPPVNYDSGGWNPESVAIADLNGDGKPDVVLANCVANFGCGEGDGIVGVLLGNGDGTFRAAVAYDSGGVGAKSVAVADFNGDGHPDIVVADVDPPRIGVLLGNGDGTFQAVVRYGAGGTAASGLTVADLNGDGKLDVVVTDFQGTVGSDGSVGILLGNGDGTFQGVVNYDTGGISAISVAVADVNGDGKPDLLVANQCSGTNIDCVGADGLVTVLLGKGDGTFGTAVGFGSGGTYAYSVAVADVNGDGKPDLLVTNLCGGGCGNGDGGVDVLLGNGDGTFATAVNYDTGGPEAFSVAVADVNGDGKPDLLVASECGSVSCETSDGAVGVLLGNGDGTFAGVVNFDTGGVKAVAVAAADVNGDGRLDLVVANYCGTGIEGECEEGEVAILLNSGLMSTTTYLISSPNPSNFNQVVTFTATVAPQGSGTATGTVSFYDGSKKLGVSSLNGSETATFLTSGLAVGAHNMTAVYGGDSNFATSTSPIVSQVVQGAVVVISPAGLGFANQVVFTSSGAMTATLANTGKGLLKIAGISISGPFTLNSTCGATVPAGESCLISVAFKPTTIGALSGAVSIKDNGPGSPQKISLTGVGTYVELSPASENFGNQPVGTKSLPKKITLSNKGSVAVSITGISITGTNAKDFSETNTCGKSVAAGASCFITVTFKPAAQGSRAAAVSVDDNGGGSPQKVSLAGAGT